MDTTQWPKEWQKAAHVWTKKADRILEKLKARAKSKGFYENFGQNELRDFQDRVRPQVHYQVYCYVSDYLSNKIDNLSLETI